MLDQLNKRVFRRLCLCLVPLIVLAFTASPKSPGSTPFVPPGSLPVEMRRSNRLTPNDMVTMQYPNSDVLDVLHLYENLTGKKLVMDNNVQGKVNIFIAKPIPREEAIRLSR